MRFVGRGHPAIRATHAKTLELSPDSEITERASCVIAVDVRAEAEGPLAGPVRVTITVADESFTVRARANSSWDPAGPAVLRRSPLQLPGTLATQADAAAAQLPRSLVAALQSPDAVVEVRVDPEPETRRTVVLFAADPGRGPDARLRAELAAAGFVVAEDADARRLVAGHIAAPGSARVLVVAVRDLPGTSLSADTGSADAVSASARSADAVSAVETVGLPARLGAAAASPSRGPIVLAPTGADPRELLRSTPAGHRLVLSTDVGRLADLLALAAQIRGRADATLTQEHAPPVRTVDGRVPPLAVRDTVHCCFDAASMDDGALEPAVRATVDGLLADGVPTKTAARALSTLTGWPQRRAYDTVLAWRE